MEKQNNLNDLEGTFFEDIEDVDCLPKINKKVIPSEIIEEIPYVNDLKTDLGDLSFYEKMPLKLQWHDFSWEYFDSITDEYSQDIDLSDEYYSDEYTINARKITKLKSNLKSKNLNFDFIVEKPKIEKVIKKAVKIKTKRTFNLLSGRFYSLIKKIFVTCFLLVVIVFWLWIYKDVLINSTMNWFKNLENLKNITSIKEARSIVNDSKKDFLVSSILSKPLNLVFNNRFFKIEQMTLFNEVNIWWNKIISALDRGLFLESEYERIIKNKWIDKIYFSEILENSKPYLDLIHNDLNVWISHFEKASAILEEKPEIVWLDLYLKFDEALTKLKEISEKEDLFNKNIDNFLSLMWHETEKTYLIAFQNNDELRPTWGFMWSVWIVKIFKWKITSFESRDIYSVEFDIKPFTELAPKWLDRITKTYGLRDSNYYADFDKSSKEIKSFIDKTDVNIDGIVYYNMNALKPFLDKLWWVYVNEVDTTFTSENFASEMSMIVEAKLFKDHSKSSPKDILFLFMNDFFDKIKSDKNYSDYAQIALNLIKTREIYFTSFDKNLNKNVSKFQNNYKFDTLDFNLPYYTSISGNKSDRYIDRTFEKTVKKSWQCWIETTLTIVHNHNFFAWDKQNITKLFYKYNIPLEKRDELMYIAGSWENRQYVRVKIPKNAIVKTSQNEKTFENYKELDFYIYTKAWKESEETIKYILENPECKPYTYSLMKQPWIYSYNLIWDFFSEKIEKKFFTDFIR